MDGRETVCHLNVCFLQGFPWYVILVTWYSVWLEIRHPNGSFIVSFLRKTFYCVSLRIKRFGFHSFVCLLCFFTQIWKGSGDDPDQNYSWTDFSLFCFLRAMAEISLKRVGVELFEGLMMYIWPQKSLQPLGTFIKILNHPQLPTDRPTILPYFLIYIRPQFCSCY